MKLTLLKLFDEVAFIGWDDGRVAVSTPEFVKDAGDNIKRDAIPVKQQAVIVPRGEMFPLNKYIHPTGKSFIEGGNDEFVEVWCAFDDAEKIWYVRA